MQTYRFAIVVEKDAEGYFAYCPELQGCYTQGDTYEEVIANVRDAIRLHVEDRLASNEPITTSETISFSSLEVVI
ncbi:MAG: type II toxin-antitoxin system HicB family antitoxin [Chloroflexota bacterium]|nr:type II toxin-antitoxin system HicB family antitoxin [Chloroflexota bacterium]